MYATKNLSKQFELHSTFDSLEFCAAPVIFVRSLFNACVRLHPDNISSQRTVFLLSLPTFVGPEFVQYEQTIIVISFS